MKPQPLQRRTLAARLARWCAWAGLLAACAHPDPSASSRDGGAPAVTPAPKKAEPALDKLAWAPPPDESWDIASDPSNDLLLDKTMEAVLGLPSLPPGSSEPRALRLDELVRHQDLVQQRLQLDQDERKMLDQQGFVVLDRFAFPHHLDAYHEIYQSQIPIYISTDSILHAFFLSHEEMLSNLERYTLMPLTAESLKRAHEALPSAAQGWPEEVARDVDLYLTVARSLLGDQPVEPRYAEQAARAQELFQQAKEAKGIATVDLFGRPRAVDFSQYQPRGYYDKHEDLKPWFRGAMWLSRLELNLVSRSSKSSHPGPLADPSETPREALGALALAELMEQAGVDDDLQRVERAWRLFGGPREDVSVQDLLELRAGVGAGDAPIASLRDPKAFDTFKANVGDGWRRTANFHVMPEGTGELPAIFTLLGPAITADTASFRGLVNDAIPGRYMVHGGDVAYLMGHDRGLDWLKDDLASYPTLKDALPEARATLEKRLDGDDIYSLWLKSVRALSQRPEGLLPSYWYTQAWKDMRANSALVGYGQLRHNNVLLAAQAYDVGGCEIPDGYVEPDLAVYDALLVWLARAEGLVADFGIETPPAYFAQARQVLKTLRHIATIELAGEALPKAAKHFLSMVAEIQPGSSGGGPIYDGWYFRLFFTRQKATEPADFIADYYTSGYTERVAYVGAQGPRLGVFRIDSDWATKWAVGPVASGYQHISTTEKRLTDEDARALETVDAPWRASYTIPTKKIAPPPLSLSIGGVRYDEDTGEELPSPSYIYAAQALPEVELTYLDHHRQPVFTVKLKVPKGKKLPVAEPPKGVYWEGVLLRVGDYKAWLSSDPMLGGINASYINPPAE